MSRITIQCIVEGCGEVEAVPALLHRLVPRVCPDCFLITLRPIFRHRSSIVQRGELERHVEIAAGDVRRRGGILILLDADDDLPCELAPTLLARAKTASRGCPVSVVLPNREYEAGLIASAAALAGNSGFPSVVPQHQADLTRLIDIDLARQNSPSFNKLCRDVERLCQDVTARFPAT